MGITTGGIEDRNGAKNSKMTGVAPRTGCTTAARQMHFRYSGYICYQRPRESRWASSYRFRHPQ